MKITVKAKIDGGTHLKYGPIIKGKEYEIEDVDFGAELFERPQGFESPHEKAEREKREAATVGAVREPPALPEPPKKDTAASDQAAKDKGGES